MDWFPVTSIEAPAPRPPLSISSIHPLWRPSILVACAASIFGVFALYGTALWLFAVWRTDDLKSVGLLVPPVCFVLILRAWRQVGWTTEGTWWGFAVLLGTVAAVFLRDQTTLVLILHKDWLVQLPPVPLLAILYALGMVLLFGGVRLLRAAWFPVLLMGAVLPVPETFSRAVDLPLQHASATVARGFAHLLGEPLTADRLRLMFTPDFGMFIAPGCNGIRGAVTLGLLAVVVAYVNRFRWYVFAPVVAGAVLLGYLFNFLRLCLLVVYYKIALPYPWLQDRAKGADYLIGGCLFAVALYVFFAVADRLKRRPGDTIPLPAADLRGADRASWRVSGSLLAKTAAVAVLALVFGINDIRALQENGMRNVTIVPMPAELGGYHLVRTYRDTLATGVVVYTWGDYQAPGGNTTVSVGVSPEMNGHDVEVCHLARGEDPRWHGAIHAQTVDGEAAFVAAMYNNGQVQTLEASTVCAAGGCRQYTGAAGAMTFVYAHPRRLLPVAAAATDRPVPMLLKVQTTDVASSPQVAEASLVAGLQAFLRDVDLRGLASHFRAEPR